MNTPITSGYLSAFLLTSCALFYVGCGVTTVFDTEQIQQNPRGRLGWEKSKSDFPRSVGHIVGPVRSLYPRFKLVLTPEVTHEIKRFTDKNRKFVTKAYNNRREYLAEIEELFEREGIPAELMNVGIIESGFDPRAVSNRGATGIWQFMKPTAKSYGLAVNFFRDDRKDPLRSSWAAARHLRDLYDTFGDWNLALAAYNAGTGSVNRAIKRGGTKDFWKLARKGHFKRQTAEYVPRVIAMSIIMRELDEYGFTEMAGELHSKPVYLSYNR